MPQLDPLDQMIDDHFINLMETEVYNMLESVSPEMIGLAGTLSQLAPDMSKVHLVIMLMALRDADLQTDPQLASLSGPLQELLMVAKFVLGDRVDAMYKVFEAKTRLEVEATMRKYQMTSHRASGFRVLVEHLGGTEADARDKLISFIDSIKQGTKTDFSDTDKALISYLDHIEDIKLITKGWLVKSHAFEDGKHADNLRHELVNRNQMKPIVSGARVGPAPTPPAKRKFSDLVAKISAMRGDNAPIEPWNHNSSRRNPSLSERLETAKARTRSTVFKW